MFLIGLTGGIASGKSTVSQEFVRLGCPVIDADCIARKVVEPGQKANAKIRATFGDTVFHEDGTLNREVLGQMIFSDQTKRKQLNSITHPEIKKQMLAQVLQCFFQGHQFAILDVPLLFETKQMLPFVSFTIAVYCSPEQQLERLMARNSLSRHEAEARIQAQLPLEEKTKLATFVIDNTGTKEATMNHVAGLYQQLRASKRHWRLRLAIIASFVGLSSVLWYFLA